MRRAIVALAGLALFALLDARPIAGAGDTTRLPGLAAPATVITDAYGIPHLRASSESDLYYLWGWVTARDRLWQLLYQRQAGRGLLHHWLGNDQLRNDGAAQLFRLRERADAIWARDRHDARLRGRIERYTLGINEVLWECRAKQRAWPREVTALRLSPDDWKPEDTVLLLLGLGVTLDLGIPEVYEQQQIDRLGLPAFLRRHRFDSNPAYGYATIPGVEGAATSASPRASRVLGVRLPAATAAQLAVLAAWVPWHEPDGSGGASNEMVVGARRSASGRPLIANDPHLDLGTENPFHVVHLTVPGLLDAAGAAVPGLPAIVTGRNRRVAWGVTALGADVIDVYADTLSADGRHVKGPRGWVPVEEQPYDLGFGYLGLRFPVPGQVRRYTPHGPVLLWDPKRRLAIAARWSAFEDARISLAGMVGVEASRTADEVAARFRTLVTPTINLAVADVEGAALYQAVGLVPARHEDPPPGVLPGDGRHEWPGFIPADSMPAWRVPADRFAVNGNNRPAARSPWAWPRYELDGDRGARMAERLAGDPSVTLDDLVSVQNDVVSRSARRQVTALLGALAPDAALPLRTRAALDTLRAWDFSARRSRVAPALARAWWLAFLDRVQLTGGAAPFALAELTGAASDTLRTRDGHAESPRVAATAALATALDSLAASLGPDLASWTWGRMHRAHFAHPLAERDGRARWEPPLTPADGDGSTVCVGSGQRGFAREFSHAPAFRHVVDLADSTTSWCVIPPWNAARGDGHTADLSARWAMHAYVPLRLDWDAIRRSAAETLELRR